MPDRAYMLQAPPLAFKVVVAVGGVCGLQRERPCTLPPGERVHPVHPVELPACAGTQRAILQPEWQPVNPGSL